MKAGQQVMILESFGQAYPMFKELVGKVCKIASEKDGSPHMGASGKTYGVETGTQHRLYITPEHLEAQ